MSRDLSRERRSVWNLIKVFLSVYYSYMVEYRAELLLWVLSGSLPLILMGVWIQAAETTDLVLKPIEFVRYFLTVFVVRQFTVVWVAWDFEREIVEGKLSFRLLQPIDPGFHHVASHVAERFARVPFLVPIVGLFAWGYPGAIGWPDPGRFFLFCLSLLVAFALRFLIQYTFAMFAFWMERATAIEQFFFLFYLFFSGIIAPFEVYPIALKQVLMLTPFPYFLYVPTAILLGRPLDWVQCGLTIVAWFLIFFAWNRWLWRRGLKHYAGQGA